MARLAGSATYNPRPVSFYRWKIMLPKVVIVGRPNVGKSSLLNLLAGRRVSIVDPTAGVTRDRVSTTVLIPSPEVKDVGRAVELIDTGGFGIEDVDNLTAQVERQIAAGLAEADVVLFVVDAQKGLMPLDEKVARLLRTGNTRAPILLVANKVDDESYLLHIHEMTRLGFGEPIPLSATTSFNKRSFLETLWDHLPPEAGAEDVEKHLDPGVLIAIVGKRNAGKSTLVNALAGGERVIVSEVEGTTRDSIDVRFEIGDRVFTAIDTAGMRKTKSIKDDIEYYSMHRSLRSIRRADVALLLIDATVPTSQVDRQLGNEILNHYRPCVIVVNKWDLVQDKHTQEEYAEYLDKALQGLNFAPIAFISAKNNEGVRDLVAMALNLHEQAGHRVPTAELNRVMQQILSERGPAAKGGRHAKIYYATQLDVHPPTIGLFVNDVDLFDNNYQRYLINRLRDHLPYSEVPIKLLIRPRRRAPEDAEIAEE